MASCRRCGCWPNGPPEAGEPTDYWLSSLPADNPLAELVRLAKIRWRIEHDYRELKTALGLDHFEGRTFTGWHPAGHPGHRRPAVPHPAADRPKSGCAGLSLYAVLHEQQALLATWTGPASSPANPSTLTSEHRPNEALRGSVMTEKADEGPGEYVRIASPDEVLTALERIGVERDRPVVVLVGGAGGMEERDYEMLAEVMREAVLPAVVRGGAVVVDGGTDSGVMRLIGRARSAAAACFPLLGVAAEGTVTVAGAAPLSADAADLEPNHTAFLLVPGSTWGDEAPWITNVASAIAGPHATVTILVNGGEIAYTDVTGSLASGRPVVVLAGSGRTADAIARAAAGSDGDRRATEIAASPLVRVVDMADTGAVAAELDAALLRPDA
jgi:hypothetical protein